MINVDTLIIGAGVSGLTYAAHCSEDYLIIEKEDKVGGLCKTFYKDGYVWDYAGHFFHFANSETQKFFESKIHPEEMVKCVKRTNINYHGTIVDYPFQMNIHELPKQEFIDCLYDLFIREEKETYSSFEDMLYSKFGKSITEKFLKPYNEKLYACNLNDLDTDAMGRFFPYANPSQIILNMKKQQDRSYNSTFDYPKKGAQYFIDILLESVDTSKILTNSSLEGLDLSNKTARINGKLYHYNKLINTIPLNHLISLLPSEYQRIAEGKLSCNKVLVFNLGFDKGPLDRTVHWTYIPMKDVNFYRIGYYNNILGTDKLSMYVEIGFQEGSKIDVQQELELTLINLKKLGVITDHKLISYNSVIINPGYVHITQESNKLVAAILEKLRLYSIYSIGRYGKWTYCSIEDCMIDAINLAQRL